jgi:hypothetical protein
MIRISGAFSAKKRRTVSIVMASPLRPSGAARAAGGHYPASAQQRQPPADGIFI